MNRKIKEIPFAMLIGIISAACGSSDAPPADDGRQQNIFADEVQSVEVSCAKRATFYAEIVSNGKVAAGKYADVYWNVDGAITKINTSNGRRISKGEIIATLDAAKLKNSLDAAEASLEQARLSMQDVIIGQGYNPNADTIPESVKKLAQVKSGFLQAQSNYNSARYDYEGATLKAPISGIVANLGDRESNLTNRSRPFCRIIDPNSLCVEFSILESEIHLVKIGEGVEISAFSAPGKTWNGRISEINPYVESNGMVKATATVEQCAGLYEGMNISLKIRKDIGKMLAVPKTAVVYRSGRPVVFTAKDGTAHWNYVELSTENSGQIAITSGINEGDSVITTGNTFLADRTTIKY